MSLAAQATVFRLEASDFGRLAGENFMWMFVFLSGSRVVKVEQRRTPTEVHVQDGAG